MDPTTHSPRIALLPAGTLATQAAEAARSNGCEVTDDLATADALIWCTPSPSGLEEALSRAGNLRWVQLPFAGIERFVPIVSARQNLTWTCAKGIYGPTVAEYTLGALIAGFRRLDRYARAQAWEPLGERTLFGANVVVFGAGGIGQSLVTLLAPFAAHVTVVRRGPGPLAGATLVQPGALADAAVAAADAVVLALPLTPETTGMVDGAFLGQMKPTAWLVNVARGRHVVTDDLVDALRSGALEGAVLDVTDPEPLPTEHPLWQLGNCLVTPHVANTWALGEPHLVRLVAENCRRFAAGECLDGLVDPAAGY